MRRARTAADLLRQIDLRPERTGGLSYSTAPSGRESAARRSTALIEPSSAGQKARPPSLDGTAAKSFQTLIRSISNVNPQFG